MASNHGVLTTLTTKTGIFSRNANGKVNFSGIPVGSSGQSPKVVLQLRLEQTDWNFPYICMISQFQSPINGKQQQETKIITNGKHHLFWNWFDKW